MKKIMFNDKCKLTKAVLEGRKTMTRRISKYGDMLISQDEIEKYATYKIGEIVAVAQSYESIYIESLNWALPKYHWLDDVMDEPGFRNKMFVKASEMIHQICITGIKVERLQDISNEDCLKEGVRKWGHMSYTWPAVKPLYLEPYNTPREAFRALIDIVSDKGTWASNPWVFAYEFELVK